MPPLGRCPSGGDLKFVARLSFSQEEILARLQVLERLTADVRDRLSEAEADIAAHEAVVSAARAEFDRLKSDTDGAVAREDRLHERINRFNERVDALIESAANPVE